ncbi:dicarboxylate transport [Aliidiomarina maris]|nr:dicarboxylate transport [Aliidiomarina maris]
MLSCMRRILIVILIIIAVLGTAIGGAWWYLQRTLAGLPIEQLDYKISSIGYKHVRLAHINVVYLGTHSASEQPSVQEVDWRAHVNAQDLFITWQWQGFRPEVQIIEADVLDVALTDWPQAAESDAPGFDWQQLALPRSWHLPRDLPHRVDIDAFHLSLPCDGGCQYTGQLAFHSENKQRLLSADDPQYTQLTMQLSPHTQFDQLEQLTLRVAYTVENQLPRLLLEIQSPMSFNLTAEQQLNRDRSVHAQGSLFYEPTAQWLVPHLRPWLAEIDTLTQPVSEYIHHRVDAEYEVTARSATRSDTLGEWLGQVDADTSLQVAIERQLSLNLTARGRAQPQADNPTMQLDGEGDVEVSEFMLRRLGEKFSAGVHQQVDSSHLTSEQVMATPSLLLAYWQGPVALDVNFDLNLPWQSNQLEQAAAMNGVIDFNLASAHRPSLVDVGALSLGASGQVELNAGALETVDASVRGVADLTPLNASLAAWNADLGALAYQIDISDYQADPTSPIAMQLRVEGSGTTQVNIFSDMIVSQQPFSIASERSELRLRQANWQIDAVATEDIDVRVPFTFTLDANNSLAIDAETPAILQLGATAVTQPMEASVPNVLVELGQWRLHGNLNDLPSLQFSSQIDVSTPRVDSPLLRPVSWRWLADIAATPLAASPDFRSTGRITNGPGLILRHQLQSDGADVEVDWQLSDIFWLAGNPIAATLPNWPELLQLERGRTRAEGQLRYYGSQEAPTLNLRGQLDMVDVSGVYDTIAFTGLRSQLDINVIDEALMAELVQASVQRVEAGLTLGPGELKASYQGTLNDPLLGQVEIGQNQIAMLNGVLSLRPQRYVLSEPAHTFFIELNQLDIARLLAEYPATDIQGSGLLSGAIPVRWSPQGVFVEQGRINALPPGGQLQYRSERARQMAQSNMAMDIVMRALDDFHYSELQGDVTYAEDGTLLLALLIQGNNPALEHGRPVRLEVTLEEDLPALLASLQLVNQLNEIIQERVQQRLIQRLRN